MALRQFFQLWLNKNQGRLLLLILWQDMSFIQIRLSTVEQSLLFEQLWKDCDKNKERITLNQRLFHRAVQTELYQTISNRVVAETLHLEQLSWGLKAEDIAQAVVFAIDTPDRMSISEMVVRPTTQTI